MKVRWSKIGAAIAATAVVLMGCAGAASAEGERDSGAFNSFRLRGSNGYQALVWAISGKGYRRGEALIIIARERQGVTYQAPARVTDTRVDADLGALGEIDVTFQPSGKTGVEHPSCDRSQRSTYEKGSYVGTIDFRGEEGYTRVDAKRASFTLHPFIDFGCGSLIRSEVWWPGIPGARLRARAKVGEGELFELQANQNHPGARVTVRGLTNERRDRVRISREVTFTYPATSFDFAPDLRSAFLDPPAPFSGSALFRRDAKPANRWTGNLALDFPGRSDVSLTGARFDPSLVRARLIEGTSPPNRKSLLTLYPWLSTKPSPTAFATPSPLVPR